LHFALDQQSGHEPDRGHHDKREHYRSISHGSPPQNSMYLRQSLCCFRSDEDSPKE
jgi:hypothetical protein